MSTKPNKWITNQSKTQDILNFFHYEKNIAVSRAWFSWVSLTWFRHQIVAKSKPKTQVLSILCGIQCASPFGFQEFTLTGIIQMKLTGGWSLLDVTPADQLPCQTQTSATDPSRWRNPALCDDFSNKSSNRPANKQTINVKLWFRLTRLMI